MILHRQKKLVKMSRMARLGAVCGLCVLLVGCGLGGSDAPSDPASQAPSDKAPVQSVAGKSLVYGVNVEMPQGWVVGSSADSGVATNAEVDTHLGKGERVGILDIFRPKSAESKEPSGRISLFLVDSTKNFMREADAAKFTPEDCDRFSKLLMQREREMAAKNKTETPVLEWKLSRETINGHLALVHQGKAKSPEGIIAIYNADIYLPNGKGLSIKAAANSSVPGTEAMLRSFVHSVKINK